MAVSKTLKEAIFSDDRNLDDIRDSLYLATIKDRGFKKGGDFELSLEFCLNNGISETQLFQDDDGREIPTEINEDNLSTICASLRTNFSKQKLEAAKNMGRKLYPEEHDELKKNTSNQTETTKTVHRTEKTTNQSGRSPGSQSGSNIPTGAIIVATAVAIAAIGIAIAAFHK